MRLRGLLLFSLTLLVNFISLLVNLFISCLSKWVSNIKAPVLIEECILFNQWKKCIPWISLNINLLHPLNLLCDDSKDTWF